MERTVFEELTVLSRNIHKDNKDKGFWDDGERNMGELLMLVITEISEGYEFFRKGLTLYNNRGVGEDFIPIAELYGDMPDGEFKALFEANFKDTLPDELADAIIRILDICGAYSINIGAHIEHKLRYNKMRPYKHGKKF